MGETINSEELKLYMPLTVKTWYEENEYGEMEPLTDLFEIDNSILCGQTKELNAKLEDYAEPSYLGEEFAEHGLMAFYDSEDNDTLKDKVNRLDFTFEEVDGDVYGVAKCQIVEPLTKQELRELKDYIEGQAADGVGEGFEQQDIPMDGIKINVSLWNFDDWSLKTAEEMGFDAPEQGMSGIT
ncbi:MAG: hypothetical protein R3Y63_15875 [Eubacteriales bacterium]